MCGISGIFAADFQDRREQVKLMLSRLRHRGPDGSGLWEDPFVCLGHARLAIIDLSPTGCQPMSNEDGTVWVIANGEIYNYPELRAQLEATGHSFRGTSDIEVIPHLYEDFGEELLPYLRGMFALAIWDTKRKSLLLGRDRAGKKPLFYAPWKDGLAFASEMKALLALPQVQAEPRDQGIYDYLTFGVIPGPDTIYKGIHRVPPAHFMAFDPDGLVKKQRYWRLEYLPKRTLSYAEAEERLLHLLRESVRIRLRSDVPLGVFLSGGIDSGLITALGSKENSAPLHTYTVGFKDTEFDERHLASLVAERHRTKHHEFVVSSEMKEDIEFVLSFYDEPHSGPSAIPSFAVSRLASQYIKVALNGDGGDEVLAGYRRYIAEKIFSTLQSIGMGRGKPLYCLLMDILPQPHSGRNRYQFFHRFIRGMTFPPEVRYLSWTHDRLSEPEKAYLYGTTPSLSSHGKAGGCSPYLKSSLRLVREFMEREDHLDPVDRMLSKDFSMLLPDDHLVKMDIATMAFSLEARSPLLDHKISEFVARLPESIKIRGFTNKPLLRSLAKRLLPARVVNAPKKGFEVPIVRWMTKDLRGMVFERILATDSFCMATFEHRAIRRLLEGKDWDVKRWANIVWSLLCLEIWWHTYKQRLKTH